VKIGYFLMELNKFENIKKRFFIEYKREKLTLIAVLNSFHISHYFHCKIQLADLLLLAAREI
jgi:hypothetical protein